MKWEGSYTVEAAWIMAVSLGILTALILLGYQLFYESLLIADSMGEMVDMVRWFRNGAVLSDFFGK